MPVFDAVPGDDSFSPTRPIFIYAGNKGRILVNTMLSSHKYPMQEPIPGQVLYPPSALIFKPNILVENLQHQLNVTMIPFYAHEAIDPRKALNQQITTTSSSPIFTHERKQKNAKQYAAFYSPQEVLAQPVADLPQYNYQLDYTTNAPPNLEIPYANHRLESMPLSPTTPLPYKKFEVIYNDGEDKFQITYEDDTTHLERPLNKQTTQLTTVSPPLPLQSYTIDTNYYAFPVYTMTKLLKKEDSGQQLKKSNKNLIKEPQRIEKSIGTAVKEQNDNLLNKSNEDTLFILNSR